MADPIKDIEVILMPDGLRGPAGKDAYELAVSEGFEGTLDEWLESIIGPEGKNAYDLAVEEGFEGTLEEWLGSLRGQKGDKVDPGPQGPGLSDEEAQEDLDEVDTLKDMVIGIGSGEGGKAYPTLADAQAVDPKPADGTVFQVEEEANAGYWVFDSSEPGGTKFLREFGASREELSQSIEKTLAEYPTLADAMADDIPDGVVFLVNDGDDAGYWRRDSSNPEGAEFLREHLKGVSEEQERKINSIKLARKQLSNNALLQNRNLLTDGTFAPESVNWLSLPYQPIPKNTQITFSGYGKVSGGDSGEVLRAAVKDSSGNVIMTVLAVDVVGDSHTITTPNVDGIEIAFNVAAGNGVGSDPANSPFKETFMMNEGDVALPYEDYYDVYKIARESIDFDFDSVVVKEDIEVLDDITRETPQLSDNSLMQKGYYTSNGAYHSSDNWVSVRFQPIQKNTQITMSGWGGISSGAARYLIRNPQGEIIDYQSGLGSDNTDPLTITTPDVDGIEIAVTIVALAGSGTALENGESPFPSSFMMNEGDVALPYEPKGMVLNVVKKLPEKIYVSPNGDDENPGGEHSPVKTLAQAKQLVSESGEVILLQGDYDAPAFSLSDFPKLRAKQGHRVRFIYGDHKITTAAQVAGYARVYSSEYTGALNANEYLWQHDIEDEETVILTDERHPFHRGRRTRLSSTRIYPAASIQEIEDTTDRLMWYKDGDTLYFSKVDGSDLSQNYIVRPSTSSIAPTENKEVFIVGIDFLYGRIRTNGLSGKFSDCSFGFSRTSGVHYDSSVGLTFERCEAYAAANDGFNGHVVGNDDNPLPYARQLEVKFIDCYGHDNADDGESCHPFSNVFHHGGLYEYNGNGITPASGGHATCYNVMTRKNGSHPWSQGEIGTGFSAQGSALDGGIGTNIICYGCISIDDGISFRGLDNSSKFINCISQNARTTDYGTGEKINSVSI